MKRSYKLQNLDCANCAAKMENAINKIDGIDASISFMTQRLLLESDDMESAVKAAQKEISKVERDCLILV